MVRHPETHSAPRCDTASARCQDVEHQSDHAPLYSLLFCGLDQGPGEAAVSPCRADEAALEHDGSSIVRP